ncbi:MAG: 2-oxoglutarate dehydrogenase complex dihydrolipoyllysine-residue succinyltransferase [Simkaniaceae bacterium]
MSVEIKVPAFGESVTEAIVAQILKPGGSIVHKDEEIVELETDKVNQVVYAPQSGKLSLQVQVDDTVRIGQVIGTIDTSAKPEEKEKPAKKAEPTALEPEKVSQEEKKAEVPTEARPAAKEPKEAPGKGARKEKEEFLTSLEGPAEAARAQETAPLGAPKAGETRKRMSGLRRTIAKKLVEVKNQTAMLTTFNEVDMSEVMAVRSKEKEAFEKKHGVRLGFMSFFVKACVQALKAFPDIKARIEGDEVVYPESFDIGVAVSTEKGLMVPVIRNCDRLAFAGIEKALTDFAKKAREGKLSIDDLQGGCFTITNGGVFGSLLSTPILNPPQSGILGMHSIQKRPVVKDDAIVIRPMMYLALSYDHRIVDGKEAVTFLVHIKENLEDPARLLLDF